MFLGCFFRKYERIIDWFFAVRVVHFLCSRYYHRIIKETRKEYMEQLKNLDLNQFMNNLNSMDIDKLAIASVVMIAGVAISTVEKIYNKKI